MMSIETIVIKHIKSDICYKDNCVHKSMLNINSEILKMNSQKLESIVEKILTKFKDLSIDRKLTFNPSLLAGITIDWRHLDNWNLIKKEVEPCILKIVNNEINNNNPEYSLYIQRYSTHPFIDMYILQFAQKKLPMIIYMVLLMSHILIDWKIKTLYTLVIQKMTILHSEKQIFQ